MSFMLSTEVLRGLFESTGTEHVKEGEARLTQEGSSTCREVALSLRRETRTHKFTLAPRHVQLVIGREAFTGSCSISHVSFAISHKHGSLS